MKYIFLLVFLAVLGLGYVSVRGWQNFDKTLAELKDKNPEKYALMMQQFKSYQIDEGKRLYAEIKAMTQDEVTMLRYTKLRDKWRADEEFKKDMAEEEHKAIRKDRKARRKAHTESIQTLTTSTDGKIRAAAWNNLSPWSKTLVLREKCRDYFLQEVEDNTKRVRLLEVPRSMIVLGRPDSNRLDPSAVCEQLVEVGHDEKLPEKNLRALKEKLNYFNFLRLLDDLGIPEKNLFSAATEHYNRFAGDFPLS